jgi:hypothetical protein
MNLRFFGAKKEAKKHSPYQGLPPREGCKVRIWENRKSLLPFLQAGTSAFIA